jgi:hypothetical protein
VWTSSHQAGSRHMSLSDPCLSRVRVFSALESRDPAVSSPDPTQKDLGPVLEVRSLRTGSGAFLAVGSDLLRASWSTSLSLAMWRPRGSRCGAAENCSPHNQRPLRRRSAFILWQGVPLFQGTDSGPRAHLRRGCEPAGGAKTCILCKHSMAGDRGISLARCINPARTCCQTAIGHTNCRARLCG